MPYEKWRTVHDEQVRLKPRPVTDEQGKPWLCEYRGPADETECWIEFKDAAKEAGEIVRVPVGWRELSDPELLRALRRFLDESDPCIEVA